ncbi:unnamed protein product [Vitrella brassicaformis CCMP3155]|uniref:Uncharacterized protein n=1 Tax=Vitrella brassicaformis (strain CCMP3155) TaxID=1169540 RepID=A0A0G4ET78_VITBC|nr:unnamed protein product [Vitrella brassicaformis CCMP3155]|eukprot:CEM01643.1 unnamed protein product [Vitrella brassicaformis CCMP3155]
MSSPSSLLVLTLEEASDLIVDAERSLSSHLRHTLETIQRGTHESIRRLHGLLPALIDNASMPLGVSVGADVLMLWMSAWCGRCGAFGRLHLEQEGEGDERGG